MKTVRRISAGAILSLTLAISAFAGHIETPGAPAPGPKSTTTITTTTTNVTTAIVLTITSLIYP